MFETDIHSHLLPMADEGSRSLHESVTMAKALRAVGVRRVHLTPHQFRFGNELDRERVLSGCEEVRRALLQAEVDIEVVPSAEYFFGERLLDAVERGEDLLTFEIPEAGDGLHLLVELPLHSPVVGVRAFAERLLRRGIRPVMAHPERVDAVVHEPDRVREWRDAGWRMQLDLLSLVGKYGRDERAVAVWMQEEGLFDHVGSDLHRTSQCSSLREAHGALVAATGPEPS